MIAIVGGRRIGYSGFNRALDAARPMGSVVKPFVYLTALETHRYNPASIVQDAPVDIRMSNGTHWRPLNFTRQTYGPVPLVRALAESLNLATVAVGMDVGVPTSRRRCSALVSSALRRRCRRCSSARSMRRRSKWRSFIADSPTAAIARRCARCARC